MISFRPCASRATPLLIAITVLCIGSVSAADISIKGATVTAPAACAPADGALVCRLDNQQFELWVNRKPLAPNVEPTDPLAKRMVFFTKAHESAVGNIMRSTNNETAMQFSSYGPYSAMGSVLPGKGAPTSPSVRFASVLHDEEIWEFMEVVAVRTPAIEALSKSLQASLKLPAAAPSTRVSAVSSTPAMSNSAAALSTSGVASTAPDARFDSKLLSLQYPTFLEPIVVEDTAVALSVKFRHTARASGPHLTLVVRAPADKLSTAAVAAQRKAALEATMSGPSASVPINTLGAIHGAGFALLGVLDAAKGFSGLETIETFFVGDVGGRQLEAQVSAEQKYSAEAQAVWGLMSKSMTLRK